MKKWNLLEITGTVQRMEKAADDCSRLLVTIRNEDGVSNIVITQKTYVIDMVRIRAGMKIRAFYDVNQPLTRMTPPQYEATIVGRNNGRESVYVGYFDKSLLAADGSLQLDISWATEIVSSNGQKFACPVGEHDLIVFYSATTRSNPPQTTPRKIIVMQ